MGFGKIPDRWEQYKSLGKQIPGTRFIAFKVPLRKEICQEKCIDAGGRFTPSSLQTLVKDQGLNLGLVIDLTFTDRYYHPGEFKQNDIQHIKIATQGKIVPNRKVCKRFQKVVDKFLEENKENDLLVGVHCTHGVNRTGYLLCRYMIDKLDFEPEKAIEACGTARGYSIERENYIDALKRGKSNYDDVPDDDGNDEEYRQHKRRHHNHDRVERVHFQGHPRGSGSYRGGDFSQGHPRVDGYSQGHPSTFNGYTRGRGGYGNVYHTPAGSYQVMNSDFAPKTFGYQHDACYGNYGQFPVPHPQWNGTYGNYSRQGPSYPRPPRNNYDQQRSYSRQGSRSGSQYDRQGNYSRQNNWSGPQSGEQGRSGKFSKRPNQRTNPYAAYS